MDVFSNCSNVISDALERRRSAGVVVLAEFLKVTALAGVDMPLPRSDRERGMDNLGLRDRRGCVSLWVSSRGGVVMAVVADPLIILCYMLNAAEKAQGILTMNKQPTGSTLQTTVVVLLL